MRIMIVEREEKKAKKDETIRVCANVSREIFQLYSRNGQLKRNNNKKKWNKT